MDPREFDHSDTGVIHPADAKPSGQVRIALTFTVRDREALWDAAASRGLAAPGMIIDDVVDVIGPREDPSIPDCLAMLVQPMAAPGCLLDQFDVSRA